MAPSRRSIGMLNEGPLHAALKNWYAGPDDRLEVPVDGRQIDIVQGDLLVEIQTGSFSAMRKKLDSLLPQHSVRVVHPVPVQKWIVRVAADGRTVLGKRKSPKTGRLEDVFTELVSLASALSHPRFSLHILLTHEEEVRQFIPGRKRRRKGWATVERRLVAVVESHLIQKPADLAKLVPTAITADFTTLDLAQHMQLPRGLAQKAAYCLRAAGVIEVQGKRGNARVYRRCA